MRGITTESLVEGFQKQNCKPLKVWKQNEMKVHICLVIYEGHLESKERFAIKKYLLIIGKKRNMQVLSHTFTYFST